MHAFVFLSWGAQCMRAECLKKFAGHMQARSGRKPEAMSHPAAAAVGHMQKDAVVSYLHNQA